MSSTPSSDPAARVWRLASRLGLVLLAVMAVGLVLVVLGSGASTQARIVAGVVLVVVGPLVGYGIAADRAHRRAMMPRTTTLDDRPATIIPMRPYALVWVLGFVAAVLGLVALAAVLEPKAGLGFLIVFGLPALSLLPDTVAGLRARAGLVMSEELVELRAWDRVTRFAWEDVEVVDLAVTGFGPVLAFVVDESSAHFATRSTRRIWRFGPSPRGGRHDLPIAQLGDDAADLGVLVSSYRADPGQRHRLTEPW